MLVRALQVVFCAAHFVFRSTSPLNPKSMSEKNRQQPGGRKPKANPAVFRYSVSFNAEEHAEFLSRFERLGLKIKAHFIAACISKVPA
jgi:hypothetical protein